MKRIIFIVGVLLSFTSARAQSLGVFRATLSADFESLCMNIEDIQIRAEVERAFEARHFNVIKWDKTLPKNYETGIIELYTHTEPKAPNSGYCGTMGIRIRDYKNQIFSEIDNIDVIGSKCSHPYRCCYENYGRSIERFLEEEYIVYHPPPPQNLSSNYQLSEQNSSNSSAQVPCQDLNEWTEKDLINAEVTLLPSGKKEVPLLLVADGTYLYKRWPSTEWADGLKWELEGNRLKINNSVDIELNEPIIGQTGVSRETNHKFIVKEFKAPNRSWNYNLIARIKCMVEQKINKWQQKGEFEKLAAFQARVSENNRNQKIREYQKEVIDSLKGHFRKNIWQKEKIQIGAYDSENETFLMQHPEGDFILPVSIDRAPQFKDAILSGNKDYIELHGPWITYDSDFILSDDKFILSSLTFHNKKNGLTFQYDIGDSKKYFTTEIDYSFTEIELPDINSSTKTSAQIRSNNIRVGSSVVDLNIPTNSKVDNRYAIVIGNEDYSSFQRNLESEQNVDYASHDAEVFKKYCLNTLGVKEENMNFLINATAGSMNQKINKILKLMEKLGPDGELIFYYAGHGFPDEQTKEPYLIPVDVSGTDLSYALALEELYKRLGNTGAKATIFLDACFTGSGRNAGLVAARGVRVKPKQEILNGNVVVFSASSGEQSALPYHKEGHGLFTYYLLEKLQESEGDISYGDLADYIDSKVSVTSININEKEQDPVVNTSEKVADSWRNWSF